MKYDFNMKTVATISAGILAGTLTSISSGVMAQEAQIISHRHPALEFYTSKMAEALPDMPADVTLMPIDQQQEKSTITLSSGSDGLDIIYVNGPALLRFAKAGWLEPLDDYWEAYKEEYNLADFPEPVLDALRYDGKLYAVPFQTNAMMFFYRKDLFAENGLQPPQTFDEYLAAAKQFNSPALSGTTMTLKPVDGALNETHWYLNSIGDGWFDENFKPIFNNANGIKAIETLKAMSQYAPRGFTSHSNDESTVAFQQGFAAMGLQWLTRAGAMDDPNQSRVVDEIGFSQPPQGGARVSISGYAISKFSSLDKEKLFEMMAVASNQENMRTAASMTMPPRRSLIQDPELQEKYRYYDAALKSIDVGKPFPELPEFLEVGDIVTRYVLQAVTGELPVQEAMDRAAAETEELLSVNGYY